MFSFIVDFRIQRYNEFFILPNLFLYLLPTYQIFRGEDAASEEIRLAHFTY